VAQVRLPVDPFGEAEPESEEPAHARTVLCVDAP
jgi:hypothetical protein